MNGINRAIAFAETTIDTALRIYNTSLHIGFHLEDICRAFIYADFATCAKFRRNDRLFYNTASSLARRDWIAIYVKPPRLKCMYETEAMKTS